MIRVVSIGCVGLYLPQRPPVDQTVCPNLSSSLVLEERVLAPFGELAVVRHRVSPCP
jgi:hypothetical protein